MEDLYGLHSSISCSDDVIQSGNLLSPAMTTGLHCPGDGLFQFNSAEAKVNPSSDVYDLTKAQIANHPLYPNLVSACIECRKVGAPPEMISLLEDFSKNPLISTHNEIGADPELDEFMESYCEVLHKFKEEISKQFDEATEFLSNMETQLNKLCTDTLTTKTSSSLTTVNYNSDEASGTSEDLSCEEVETLENQDLSGAPPVNKEVKEMLLQKYSLHLSSLRKECLKTRKKGKLPKEARAVLLEWWNTHYRWPYPTEEEKMKLSEITGLDQKQINNWFINQRKRHWRPSEDMKFALMGGVGGSFGGSMYYDLEGGSTTVDF